jgi:hypothetical protein
MSRSADNVMQLCEFVETVGVSHWFLGVEVLSQGASQGAGVDNTFATLGQ